MAASIVSGSSRQSNEDYEPQFHPNPLARPPDTKGSGMLHDFDEDVEISYSCMNGTQLLKISSALMVFSFVLQVCFNIYVNTGHFAALALKIA